MAMPNDLPPSRCATTQVPPTANIPKDGGGTIAQTVKPVTIAHATKYPMRVLVRNISALGVNVMISYDQASLQTGGEISSAQTYILPPGQSDVFPLLPNETLYGVSPNTLAGQISYAITVAFPFEVKP